MNISVRYISAVSAFICLASASAVFGQGSLIPPGAPAPTMKTLDQVEARIIINAANTPGNATNQFIIYAAGSYYLTSNIIGVSGKNGIMINATNVTIDLNGYLIFGVSGSGTGIWDGGNNRGNAIVRNGTVLSWGGAGIDLAASYDSRIENLIVTNNGGVGMKMSDGCVLRDCMTRDNAGDNISTGFNANVTHCTAVGSMNGAGFNLGQDSVMTDCVANFNFGSGVNAAPNCMISHCVTAQNQYCGIYAGNASTIAQCDATGNASYGIIGHDNATLTDCTATSNSAGVSLDNGCTMSRCTVAKSTFSGLAIGARNQVTGCTIESNNPSNTSGKPGLLIQGAGNRVDSNHFASNGYAGLTATGVSGNIIIRNTFYGAQSIIDSGNITGPGVVMSSGGTISTTSGSPGTSPWANIYY